MAEVLDMLATILAGLTVLFALVMIPLEITHRRRDRRELEDLRRKVVRGRVQQLMSECFPEDDDG